MKMKLQLDELQVESFVVAPDLAGYGTVKGLQFVDEIASGLHSQCYTHCLSNCEATCTCPSNAATHCAGDSCSKCVPPTAPAPEAY